MENLQFETFDCRAEAIIFKSDKEVRTVSFRIYRNRPDEFEIDIEEYLEIPGSGTVVQLLKHTCWKSTLEAAQQFCSEWLETSRGLMENESNYFRIRDEQLNPYDYR